MRKKIAVDLSDKKIIKKGKEIEKQSFINDIEYKYVFALNYPIYAVDENSNYFLIIKEYITIFFADFDVIGDMYHYFKLFGKEESKAIRSFTRSQVEKLQMEYDPEGETPPSIDLIRWRIVDFKINKILGAFDQLENSKKLNVINTIVQTYLWAFYDVKKVENGTEPTERPLTDIDKQNLDDLIIISVEILMGFNQWDNSILQPCNYMALILLEYG